MEQKLTLKQEKWLAHYLDRTNPDTFGNACASAKAAGYQCTSQASYENVGSQNFKRLSQQIEQFFDDNDLSPAKLKQALSGGLQATETKFFAHQGQIVTERETVSWAIRQKYLEMALRVKGLFSAEKLELTGKDGGPIDLTTLVMKITGNESESKD